MNNAYQPQVGDLVTLGESPDLWQVRWLYEDLGGDRAELDRVLTEDVPLDSLIGDVETSRLRLHPDQVTHRDTVRERKELEAAARGSRSEEGRRARARVAAFVETFNPGQYSADVVLDQGHGPLLLSDLVVLLEQSR